MHKENARLKPADNKENAKALGKYFKCLECGHEFLMKGVEFGERIMCPVCDSQAVEKESPIK